MLASPPPVTAVTVPAIDPAWTSCWSTPVVGPAATTTGLPE